MRAGSLQTSRCEKWDVSIQGPNRFGTPGKRTAFEAPHLHSPHHLRNAMQLDSQNIYSDTQALIASARSTNNIYHGTNLQLGAGTAMAVLVVVDVAPDHTTGDESYTVKVRTDDNAAFSSPTDVSPAYTIPNTAQAGDRFILPLPSNEAT